MYGRIICARGMLEISKIKKYCSNFYFYLDKKNFLGYNISYSQLLRK
jgi:hypothetical protein